MPWEVKYLGGCAVLVLFVGICHLLRKLNRNRNL